MLKASSMKRILVTVLFTLAVIGTAAGQNDRYFQNSPKKFALGVGGGPLVSLGENFFTYPEFGNTWGLISGQGNLWASYSMNRNLALRLSVGAGSNSGARNSRESTGHGFYPYRFTSVNGFVDLMIDPRGRHTRLKVFTPTLYLGIGYAYSFGIHNTRDYYHWQAVSDPNQSFGFRLGFEACFNVNEWLGLYVDLCAEGYTDKYNGLEPSKEDKERREGYAGFPFDVRVPLSFGVKFRL